MVPEEKETTTFVGGVPAEARVLKKDVLVLQGDVSTLAKQIVEKQKELKQVSVQIDAEREVLAKVKKLHAPLQEHLKGDIKALEDLKMKLNLEIEALEGKRKYELSRYGEDAKRFSAWRDKAREEEGVLRKKLERMRHEIDHLGLEVEKLQKEREAKEKMYEQEEEKLQNLRTIFAQEDKNLALLLESKKEVEEALESYWEFARQMDEKRKELDDREAFVETLERRLTPEYHKIFGRFANLKVEAK